MSLASKVRFPSIMIRYRHCLAAVLMSVVLALAAPAAAQPTPKQSPSTEPSEPTPEEQPPSTEPSEPTPKEQPPSTETSEPTPEELSPSADAPSLEAQLDAQLLAPSKQQVDEARRRFSLGRKYLRSGLFPEALKHFRFADGVMAVPTTRLSVAQALEKMGQLLEARQMALSVESLPREANANRVFDKARERATLLARRLERRISYIKVLVPQEIAPQPRITLDGQNVGAQKNDIAVNPGKHMIEANAGGYEAISLSIELAEGERRTLQLQLVKRRLQVAPVPTAPPPPVQSGSPIGAMTWIGVGITVVGLGTGAVAGIMTLMDVTAGEETTTIQQGKLDRRYVTSYISTGGFALAGVGATISVIGLMMVDDSSDETAPQSAVYPVLGPGYVGLQGCF